MTPMYILSFTRRIFRLHVNVIVVQEGRVLGAINVEVIVRGVRVHLDVIFVRFPIPTRYMDASNGSAVCGEWLPMFTIVGLSSTQGCSNVPNNFHQVECRGLLKRSK